ncbi:MAG: SDR family NAD(P)-dependent oxidoreductase [Bacteroidia bacterium]|nr:SDR family NAD(P)-dependent oxidoreductase [Bacteroidia bacterium]
MTKDKNILIIGASRGIGAAVLEEYARSGAHIYAASRDTAALDAVAERSGTQGTAMRTAACDVAQPDQIRKVVEMGKDFLGRIDVFLYNAGVGGPAWMRNFSAQDTERVFAVNFHGLAVALECAIPLLREQGGGVFAGVGSLADVRGYPGTAAYCASKAAAAILLESARVELRPLGIHVLTVRPGFVRTAMTAMNEFHMPFMLEPERAARIIIRGIARRKSVIQFPWQIALATRIIRILPNALFDMTARKARTGKS